MIQSATFWLVLFCSVLIFWNIPKKIRIGFLSFVSIGYLLSLDFWSVSALVVWTLAFYWLAPQTIGNGPWRKRLLLLLILLPLGYLAYFKYIPRLITAFSPNSLAESLLIPLGISYFTFKLIHYAIEVKRGNITDRSFQQFFCYIFLFSIFTAGPIERFDHFLSEQENKWRSDFVVEGLTRIIHGIIKKFFVSNVVLLYLLGHYASDTGPNVVLFLDTLSILPTYKVWGFLVLSYLYVYMDFSAYSDIAIGASRLFGIRIMENFDFPILAQNIANFWQRWHMTLGRWCQSYVYMPMIGLTRNPYIAVYCTWLAIGLWHAGSLNWVFWGLYHGTGVAIFVAWGRFKRRKKWFFLDKIVILRYMSIPVTFLFVSGSGSFTAIYGHGGVYDGFRILAKLIFINLPA
jgi:alginate O-acetyltransferase complex protein AlgI